MTQTIDVWTKQHHPMELGGPATRDVRSEVPGDGPHDLGKGYLGWLITAPDGGTFVVEGTSHAIVGSALEEVREDVRQGDAGLMAQQVQDGLRMFQQAQQITPEQLWAGLSGRKG